MPIRNDKTGLRFGRLLVLTFKRQNKHGQSLWLCRCDCGRRKIIRGFELATGGTKSCGCLRHEGYHFSHRQSGTPTYSTWKAMRQRCNNPNHSMFRYYGGRGIKVCKRWSSFEKFLTDMGKKPVGKSIDRIDSDGNYEPNNCRWATSNQQWRNRHQSDMRSAALRGWDTRRRNAEKKFH